jgi:hypothetical protein
VDTGSDGEEVAMQVRGFIRSAELEERPAGSGTIEMVLKVQGVGPGQPRGLVVPYALLLDDSSLDPDDVVGRSFAAEVGRDTDGRWLVREIALAAKVLRPEE